MLGLHDASPQLILFFVALGPVPGATRDPDAISKGKSSPSVDGALRYIYLQPQFGGETALALLHRFECVEVDRILWYSFVPEVL